MRILTRICRFVAVLIGLACLLAALGYGALQSGWGNRQIAQLLEQQLDARIDGLSGSLPFAPRMQRLELHDTQGAWLVIENARIDWHVQLLPFTWHVEAVAAERIHWIRTPPTQGASSDETTGGISLPRLRIAQVNLPEIEIAPAVAGERYLLAAQGSLRTAMDHAAPQAEFTLRSIEGPSSVLTLQANGPALQATFTEAPDGPVGSLLGLGTEEIAAETHVVFEDGTMRIERFDLAAGARDISMHGTVEDVFGTPEFSLQGDVVQWNNRPQALAELITLPLPFALEGSAGDTLRIETLQVKGERFQLTGDSIRLGEPLEGTLSIAVADASHLHPELRGALDAQAELGGSIRHPQIHFTSTLRRDGQRFTAEAQLRQEAATLHLSDLTATTDGIRITGTVAYAMDTALADGILQVTANDLSGLSPFLAAPLAGKGDATLRLAAASGAQAMQAEGSLADLSYGDFSARKVTFDASVDDLTEWRGIDAALDAQTVASGDTVVDRARFTAKGSATQTQFTVVAHGSQPSMKLDAGGQLKAELPDWELRLARLRGTYQGMDFALAAPTTLSQKKETLVLAPATFTLDDGRITAQGSYQPKTVDLRATLANLPLSTLSGGAYRGRVAGDIRITGSAASPTASFDLTARGLTGVGAPPEGFTLDIDGALKPQRLEAQARMLDIEGTLAADLRVPARFSLAPFTLALPPNEALAGTLHADAPIGPLMALLLPPGHTLGGRANGELQLRGTLDQPWAEGMVQLRNGWYENEGSGTRLTQLNLQFQAARERLRIRDGSAKAGDGMLRFSGDLGMAAPYAINLQATLANAALVDSPMVSGVANGAVQLEGTLEAMTLGGEVILGPMEIRLPDAGGPNVPTVKIRNPSALPRQPWQEAEKESDIRFGPSNVKLDLIVKAPHEVFVRGRGLETEMRGEITIGNTLAAPELQGELRSVRGTFVLLDRQLDITEGTAIFRGAIPPSPYIVIVAETETSALTAGVRIEGPIRDPQLTLTSTPSRPEDEILAHLLFGRELASITPLQGVQLAQALRNLRGGGGGVSLIGKARDLLGVDRLDIGETDEGDVNVGAGKYISEKVYVGVESGADAGSGKVKAEIELTPRFSVETESGGRASGLRFNWKRDY